MVCGRIREDENVLDAVCCETEIEFLISVKMNVMAQRLRQPAVAEGVYTAREGDLNTFSLCSSPQNEC